MRLKYSPIVCEFMRYDAEICGRANSKETVFVDFSLVPIKNELGEIVFLVAEGRNAAENKTAEREIPKKNADPQFLLEHFRERDDFLEEDTKDSEPKPTIISGLISSAHVLIWSNRPRRKISVSLWIR